MFYSAVKDFIIFMLLTVSDNLEVLSCFYFADPAHNLVSIKPVKINIGDSASVTKEIRQEAKKAMIIPVRNELKL